MSIVLAAGVLMLAMVFAALLSNLVRGEPRMLVILPAVLYGVLVALLAATGPSSGCFSGGGALFGAGVPLLLILVIGPTVVLLMRRQFGRAVGYLAPAIPIAVMLFAAGFVLVLLTGAAGCR